MKGSTHLAIGIAIGVAASLYYPVSLNQSVIYLSVASVSALSADLDGPSLLSSKMGKLSKWIRELGLWSGFLLVASLAYVYFTQDKFYPVFTTAAITLFLLGFVTKVGIIRNALVSLVGGALFYAGYRTSQNWLMGFGLFVACVPWLKHRGMTHTVWSLFLWGVMGAGLEQELQIEGIMAVSILGYSSHLIADTFTPAGVKWLYPIYRKSIKL
jgi:inner membrane protein